ncbi:phytanoyl-CoA dioxygenase family protein [Sphingomonas sp. ST-64]|uniref:Phytanoyl-CoA dioxygenase family protein n=1 Tax=Sphingomonas plantiphila TaxID=3163295 RepID=A0ABW8YN91_9SPHN
MQASASLREIRGFEALWAELTFRVPRVVRHDQSERMLIDTLGLGLEQLIQYLGSERPELIAFEHWVIATAGRPDPLTVARYHATLDGAPLPTEVQARLAAIDAMPNVLDTDDLAQWEREGWVTLRHAISRDEAAEVAALLWRLLDADPARPESWYGQKLNGIMVQHFQNSALEIARRAPRVHKAFAQLWGTSDLWCIVDRLSFNPPETAERPFQGPKMHWDVSLAPPIPFATQGILYLTDTATDQGAFALLPGFHHRLDAWLEEIGDTDPRMVHLDPQAVPIAAGAGDLIIWRNDLPHGASPNRSTRPRLAQYVNFYAPTLTTNRLWR